ncbi:MAG TPA: glycosyl transferase family 1, partial [Tenuifilaceae bacterium]|nr:glycosyl transferase family 1 [Tenuifilaceae bacterium]
DNTVEVEVACRPCSVYGNKPCFRKDYACLNRITPEMIISKVNSVVDRYGRI